MKASFIVSNHSTSLYSGPKQLARCAAEPVGQGRLAEAGKDIYDLSRIGLWKIGGSVSMGQDTWVKRLSKEWDIEETSRVWEVSNSF